VAPSATVAGSDRVLGYDAADGSVFLRNLSTGAVIDAGGHLIGAPALLADGGALVLVFGQGTDHRLWLEECNLSLGCGGWVSAGGSITSQPAAVRTSEGSEYYAVYARGADGALWVRTHVYAGWQAWRRTGGQLLAGTGPAAANAAGDGLYALVVGTNHQLYLQGPGFTGFNPVGGRTNSTPALIGFPAQATPNEPRTVVGFARGTDNAGWYRSFASGTGGWTSMSGTLTTGVAASVQLTGSTTTTYAYGLGTDGSITEDAGSWASPTSTPSLSGWHPAS
jgi:hypothetical protein